MRLSPCAAAFFHRENTLEENKNKVEKVINFLASMKFAIGVLVILAAACAAGSFITQGQTYEQYAAQYGESMAHLIALLGLQDVFHSFWFLILSAMLCLSLLMCNVLRMPKIMAANKSTFTPEAALKRNAAEGVKADVTFAGEDKANALFTKMRFGKGVEGIDEKGRKYRYADRNKMGSWGAWITHLGILVLIVGFGLGQMMTEKYVVYGVPGQEMQVEDTQLYVSIDDFAIDKNAEGTVTQYTSDLTVHNAADGTSQQIQAMVNHPGQAYGMKFYQNSTGWAGKIVVKKVVTATDDANKDTDDGGNTDDADKADSTDKTEDGTSEIIQEEVICVPGNTHITGYENLHFELVAMYPNYNPHTDANMTMTTVDPENPAWLYRVSTSDGQVLGMNVLYNDYVSIDMDENTQLQITVEDPQIYTLIQVKREPFTLLALLGGLVIMLGLILSFYIQPQQMLAVENEEGQWEVYGWSRKGGVLFKGQLEEAAKSV